jgi:AraC family transcriptional regulator, 4-hydroxyphenylacetate 3-monooxygenase operon regulatory protein
MSIICDKQQSDLIPNIVIGQDYDRKHSEQPIRYDALEELSVIFGHNMPVHRHAQFVQIHYIADGDVDFHIDDKVYQVKAPCCFVTPAASPHSFRIDDNATGHVLTVHQSIVRQLLHDGLQQEMGNEQISAMGIEFASLASQEHQQWRLILLTFEHLASEWNANKIAKQLSLESLIRLLIIQIVGLHPAKPTKEQVNNHDVIIFNRFSDLIEEHYKAHWLLPRYLGVMGISDTRLNLICQRIAKHSPKKLIHNRLLLEIKRMLAFTKISINDICYQTGFSDPAYFSRFFKKNTGQTALAYRTEHS